MQELSSINSERKKKLRLRVFAGPNGSGKSTVIKEVHEYTSNGRPIDFGIYINADDIARLLRENGCDFNQFETSISDVEFKEIATESGLINGSFTQLDFNTSFSIQNNSVVLTKATEDERLAQIIAHVLRKKLLSEGKRFSFETVFSHESKLEVMREANAAGYKVYLYFVSTESPEINKYRVNLRTQQGGHNVPADKIESRYYRSLELLYEAAQLAYQVYFFDNSEQDMPFNMFAHFKKVDGIKNWDNLPHQNIPEWFKTYYSAKINPQ